MTENLEITFEVLKIASPIAALLLTWFVGTSILRKSEIRKKQTELDMSISTEFYKLYGEFSSVWRLWKVHYDANSGISEVTDKSKEYYWELLKRSADIEGGMEAVYLKLASERTLDDKAIKSIGLFRQAIQQLRQSIREHEKMDWHREHTEYILLKKLSIQIARLIKDSGKIPDETDCITQLLRITAINSDTWQNEIRNKKSYWYKIIRHQQIILRLNVLFKDKSIDLKPLETKK